MNRFCTDILFSASCIGYKISIYLLIFEHADIREIVEFTNDFEENNLPIVWFYSFVCNLKKILALVLAFACAFTMFAGAAFTDQADIKATDAVNMLSSLGVITGYTDGSYQPNKVVTRAEMAKMIFVVRNNKIDDSAYQSNYSKLTDISNHWAKGYIKFCESQGIIAGKGNNKFDPDSPVTGVEAAKMLLVVSGYDSDKAGLTGSAWRTNVLKYAGAAGILDDVNSALEQGLPRQYAAQMIYNTLDVNRVKCSKDSESFDDVLNGGVKETVGHAYMGLCADYGTLVSIDKDALSIKLDKNYDSDNYHTYTTNPVKFTKVAENYTSLLGQKVKVMFKDGKLNNVLGVYAISDNTVYNTLMNDVEKDGQKIKFDGTSYSVDSNNIDTYFVGINGASELGKKAVSYFDKGDALNAEKTNGNTSLSEVTFVDSDGDNKIDTAIVIEKTAAKVTYASSSEIVAGDTYKAADENIAEGFAKDDYAVVSKNLYKDNKDVVKADVLNDTVNGFKTKTGYVQYKIGSTWYNAAKAFSDVDTGDKVKAYVVNGVALDISSDDSNGALPTVAVVTGIGGDTITGDQVKLTFFDGTTKTVTLDKVVKSNGDSFTAALGTAYSYSESKDGYKLTQLSGKKYNDYEAQEIITSFANTSFDSNKALISGVGKDYNTYKSTYAMDDNAKVVLVQSSGKCKVVTGKQYKALATVDQGTLTSAFTKKTNGLTKIMLASAYVVDVDKTGHSNDNYAYIVKTGYKTGDDRTAYTIWDGEKNVDVVEKVSYSAGARDKGMVIGYSTIDEDGYINDVQTYTGSKFTAAVAKGSEDTSTLYYAGVQGVNGDSWVTVDGVNKLNITKDTKILNVDSDADDDDQIGKSGTALFAAEEIADSGKYYINAYFVMDETFGSNDDADLAFIVFDVKGKMKGMNENSTTIAKSGTVTGVTCTADTFEAGKSYDLVLTATASSEQKVTLTGAVFAADGKSTTQKVTFDATGKATVKVIALGTAITVTGAAV